MILNLLFIILGVFTIVYVESFVLSILGLRFAVVIFFFLFRKIDWKLLSIIMVTGFLIFDVVYKFPLGSNMLVLSLPFALYLLISMFISLDSGIVPFIIKILLFWFYYALLMVLPNLFLSGSFGLLDLDGFLRALLRSVLSVLVLLLLEYLYARFRKRGNTSQIRLK